MKIEFLEEIVTGSNLKIELTNAEEVAEKGDLAHKTIQLLPSNFNINNESHMEELLSKMKPIMVEKNFDTMIIHEEKCKEHLFILG